ncbi:TorF family putative porin [Sphingomonas parva]|uniref:TorF family putative porin n=1 Tax=Sphingomonas parva TaxID=2555898 RepID=UPI001CDBEA87|nr:TorF family putative porin [Sphingomonas parva]
MVCALGAPAAARAEVAASASLASDDRFRGVSTSRSRPVAGLTLAYDDKSGFYLGVSGTLVLTRDDGIRPLRSVQYAGYARRVASGLQVDAGVTNRIYGSGYAGGYGRLTEAYVGLVGRRVSAHLFYSPDGDGYGGDTLYGDANALLVARGAWSLSGHVGLLAAADDAGAHRLVADGRLAVTRRFGRASLSLTWVGATPARKDEGARGTILLSVSRAF